MEIKTLPVINSFDALLAEIILTLRAGFGMVPAKYDPSMSGMEVPDDYSMPEQVDAESPAEEPEAEEPKAKSAKKETKAK